MLDHNTFDWRRMHTLMTPHRTTSDLSRLVTRDALTLPPHNTDTSSLALEARLTTLDAPYNRSEPPTRDATQDLTSPSQQRARPHILACCLSSPRSTPCRGEAGRTHRRERDQSALGAALSQPRLAERLDDASARARPRPLGGCWAAPRTLPPHNKTSWSHTAARRTPRHVRACLSRRVAPDTSAASRRARAQYPTSPPIVPVRYA